MNSKALILAFYRNYSPALNDFLILLRIKDT